MNVTKKLVAAVLTAVAASAAQAYSDDAAFDRISKSHVGDVRAAWINPILPAASGDYVGGNACGDADFNRLPRRYARAESKWINALLPGASGDVMIAQGESADAQFNRQVASYTRATLDRGGWLNAFVQEEHYAAGNRLLAARVGEGVTTRITG